MENENCACVADNASACNDSVACTDNVCTNGVCTNPVSAGFCRIGGSCYAHNAQEPGNPCHFCDANANRTGWSNSASSVSCDDGLWCNGTDICSGGACTHQFTSNRCTATGPCALSVCDEARDSCFQPNTFVCSSSAETRCSSTACSGDIQTRTVETQQRQRRDLQRNRFEPELDHVDELQQQLGVHEVRDQLQLHREARGVARVGARPLPVACAGRPATRA